MILPLEFDTTHLNQGVIGTRFYRNLSHFRSVTSTNALLLAAVDEGAPDGTVFLADEQTAGRGRGGHSWHSSPGDGLYLSALVRPSLGAREALWIALATGLAAQAAILEATALPVDIRWPNDLLFQSRKLGGILVESSLSCVGLRYAVIGIGINVNHTELPEDLARIATSLRIETGTPISRDALLISLLRALDRELTRLEAGAEGLLEQFSQCSTWVRGKRVHVAEAGGYTGVTAGLDAQGFLQVVADDGTRRTVLSGGVREA